MISTIESHFLWSGSIPAMSPPLQRNGFEIHRKVIEEAELVNLRQEADRVASKAGTSCVRHLRKKSPLFNSLSLGDRLLSLLPDGLRPVRSLLFDKNKTDNWSVLWHQDSTIAVKEEGQLDGYGPWSRKDGAVHVQPPVSILGQMATIRLHLDETPGTNGALRVIPGSHQAGKLSSEDLRQYEKREMVSCVCHAGDVLVMSPLILHSSCRSELPGRRRVVHFEYARREDLDPGLAWFEDPETQ